MDFYHGQFDNIPQDDSKYEKNFESTTNACQRYTILYHTLQYLIYVNDQIKAHPDPSQPMITEDLKQLRPQDTAISLGKIIGEKYEELIRSKPEGQALGVMDMYWVVYQTFKPEILAAILFFHIDGVFRLVFSGLLLHLFEAVQADNRNLSYIYVAILTVVWYLSQLFKELGINKSYLAASRAKSALAILLYAKINKLTFFVLKGQDQVAKITNLIANDLIVIEQRCATLLHATCFPMMIIGVGVILYIRIGWPSLVGILLVIISIPIGIVIGQRNFGLLKNVNAAKDKRITLSTDMMEGVKYIKVNGWEMAFKRLIRNSRDQEVALFKSLAFGRALERGIGNCIGLISTLVMYIIAHHTTGLSTPKIFSVAQISGVIKMTVLMVVLGLGLYYETNVVFTRFSVIFSIEEKSMIKIDEETKSPVLESKDSAQTNKPLMDNLMQSTEQLNETKEKGLSLDIFGGISKRFQTTTLKRGQIKFTNFNGYWKKQFEQPALKNINFTFESPKLYGITGKIGSGKSGLIGAILADIPYYSGQLQFNGTIAYVQQEPVVFSESIRSNILFGRNYDKTLYEKSLRLSGLIADIQGLPLKDMTMVGQKGVNISGGEQARIAIARAVYSEADIYIMDNPLASIDYKVGKKIFTRCIEPLSKQKTVLFVTHRLSYLNECDEVLLMEDGKIVTHGPPEQISGSLYGSRGNELTTTKIGKDEVIEEEHVDILQIKPHFANRASQGQSQIEALEMDREDDSVQAALRINQNATSVGCQTYGNFIFADKINYVLLPICFLLFLGTEAVILAYLRILADYENVVKGTSSTYQNDFGQFWGVLAALVVAQFICLVLKYYLVNICLVMDSTIIHDRMMEVFLRVHSTFFDTIPSGVIINKFTTDLGVLDNNLIIALIDAVEGPILIGVALFNMIHIDRWFSIPAAILAVIIISYFIYARPSFITCKQLDLQSRGPIFHFYNETVHGITQIRLYAKRLLKFEQFAEMLNRSIRSSLAFDLVSRGFGFYETIASIFLMAAGMVLGIHVLHQTNTGHYGVAVLYLITVSEVLQWILRQMICLESYLVSAQRILQFDSYDVEKALRTPYDRQVGLTEELDADDKGELVHQHWPQQPSIQVNNLSAKYRASLPAVLKNISLTIKDGEKVAIVGRSGAGKSSIVLALYRLIEPQEGCSYKIGGYNALDMGLHSLRRHISLIPQTPFIFTGTIKENLDPYNVVPEEALMKALEDAGLGDKMKTLPKQLETEITNNLEVFSVGQKQLLCLARILAKNNKIIFLDEATSSLDMETDLMIQKVIREKFKDMTVITVAHKLNTISDYDRVIVVDKGSIVEQGSPVELIEKKGAFYDLIQNSGSKESQNIIRSTKQIYLKKYQSSKKKW